MLIPITCSKCGATLKIPDGAEGKRIRCPKCQWVQMACAAKPPFSTPKPAPARGTSEPPPRPIKSATPPPPPTTQDATSREREIEDALMRMSASEDVNTPAADNTRHSDSIDTTPSAAQADLKSNAFSNITPPNIGLDSNTLSSATNTSIKISCAGCGAALANRGGLISCPYCGAQYRDVGEASHVRSKSKAKSRVDDSSRVLNQSIGKDQFISKSREYLLQGEHTPEDIIRESRMLECRCFYIPVWIWVLHCEITWSAVSHWSIDEERMSRISPDGNIEYENTTRNVSRPESGVINDVLRVGASAFKFPSGSSVPSKDEGDKSPLGSAVLLVERIWSAGNDRITEELSRSVNYSEYNNKDNAVFLQAAPADEIWNEHGNDILVTQLESVKIPIPGDRHDNLVRKYRYSEHDRALVYVPVWMSVNEYQGKSYALAMIATAGCGVWGGRPGDKNLVRLAKCANASLYVGVIALCLSPCCPGLGIPLAAAGICLGYAGKKSRSKGATAIVGLAISIVAIVISAVSFYWSLVHSSK